MTASRTRLAGGLLLLLGLIFAGAGLTATGAGAATVSGFTVPDGVTVVEDGGDCHGVVPNGASGNTDKVLLPGSVLVAGGTAQYAISFPTDPANQGAFTIVDCVLLLEPGDAINQFDEVLGQVTFSFVNNAATFNLGFSFELPDDIEDGALVCNVAKTTAAPSQSPGGNRKAGPACFLVGGSGRVEKHDAATGALVDGATFSVHDCVNPADEPGLEPIVVSAEDADGDALPTTGLTSGDGLVAGTVTAAALGFNGPSGATCEVTETAAPLGYLLADDPTVTVGMNVAEPGVVVIENQPSPTTTTSTSTTSTSTTSTSTTVAPTTTTEAAAPTTTGPGPSTGGGPTTVGPTVLGTQFTQAGPGATVLGNRLARTGSATAGLLTLAGGLLAAGGLMLLVSSRELRAARR